ncbi:G5 and 3D domain-containing protein [Halalkalibacter alkaliphilus]|uniref:Ubiquitin-like domain-containing protein n=1 Tax=Halalkalibacter alkaliphilus TaxID=2917993 RepID=A0A9X2CW06_9BACI|nr:G5 and 3D domain-containing protein [Halalkalibacter alkaliphilus]MCL7749283.1 ubiquitin-like domain-containing protein [Halalkalibacter alkaliphilus]
METNRSQLLPAISFRKKLVISVISLILFGGVITYAVYEATKATVTISMDGEEVTVQTHASTVAELMKEQEWEVQEYDFIDPGLDTEIKGNLTITWDQAKKVFVTIQGHEEPVWTTADDVEQLIQELNIDFKEEHDLIAPALNEEITDRMNLIYESAFQVELTSDGEQHELWTTSTTVADFLERESVTLGELDRVEPGIDTRLDRESEIQVIRVEKVTDVVEESVAFGTVTRKDNSLRSGKEEVVQAGEEGTVNKHYEVVLEDGKEVSRELVKTETVKESTDRIVAVGTQPAPTVSRGSSSSSSSSGSAPSGGRTLTVTATAYTAGCSGCSGITATGINLNNNRNMKVIAVDPSVIPLGTRVHVEGYGNAIAGDTGGAIKGNKIDVHVPTKSEAFRWGSRTVKVTILD